jgi:hypothetical protein
MVTDATALVNPTRMADGVAYGVSSGDVVNETSTVHDRSRGPCCRQTRPDRPGYRATGSANRQRRGVPHPCHNDLAPPVRSWHGLALIGQLIEGSCQKPRSKDLLNRPFKAAARVRIPLGVLAKAQLEGLVSVQGGANPS